MALDQLTMLSKSYKYKVSFIIPVFNAEETVLRCFNSIYSLQLDNKDFEVIVIDDCSTDNSLSVMEEFARSVNNMTIIHLPVNSKPGAARNRGIEIGVGHFVYFIDADDTVESGFVSALDYAVGSNVDILVCRIQEQLAADSGFFVKENNVPIHKRYSGRSFCEEYYNSSLFGAFSHYLINNSFIHKTNRLFAEGVLYEDLDWVEYHLYSCESIEYDPSIIYSYYYTPSSVLHSKGGPKDVDALLLCCRRIQFAQHVKEESPSFFNAIIPVSDWISTMLSFRRLSRYSHSDLLHIKASLGPEAISLVRSLKLPGFPGFFINYPQFATVLISIIHPFSEAARSLFHRVWHKSIS